jgi:hypothetical protein
MTVCTFVAIKAGLAAADLEDHIAVSKEVRR